MKKTSAIACLLGAVTFLAGCGDNNPPSTPPPGPTATPTPPQTGQTTFPPPTPQASPHSGVVYIVDEKHGSDANDYLVAKPITFVNSQSPAREAVQALLVAPQSPIPAGTQLNALKIADGLATLDFSQSPVDETHGEEKQSQALQALQRTLGQFPNVSRIQVDVNGKPASLGEAAPGPMDVLRPGEKLQDAGGV